MTSPAPGPASTPGSVPTGAQQLIKEVDLLDRAISAAVAGTPTPMFDVWLSRLSNAANYSRLWSVISAALIATGGRRGRRAAVRGMSAIAVASLTANVTMKFTFQRHRPGRLPGPEARRIPMPASTSFPSGHTASAFAFAAAVADDIPELALPLYGLAIAVAYSRVHTGVHYPTDVLAGELLGVTVGATIPRWPTERR